MSLAEETNRSTNTLWTDDETHMFQSLNRRLKIPMKPVDMATFIAEHDDHHIASMMEQRAKSIEQRGKLSGRE